MFDSLKKIFDRPDKARRATVVVEAKDKPSSQSAESAIYIKRGNDLLAREELAAAEECYRKASALSPGAAGPHICLGFVLMEQKRFAEAKTSIEKALQIDPRIADAYYMLGTISRERGDFGEAAENFKKALEINPSLERIYVELCDLFIQLKQFENAKAVIESGISLFQNHAVFHYSLGNLYAIQNESEKAINCFKKALSIDVEFPEAHLKLAYALKAAGNLEAAIDSFKQALAFLPDQAEVYCDMGLALQTQGKLDQAINSYQTALSLRPDLVLTHFILGNALYAQGKSDEAVASYQKALALKPDLAEAHYGLGIIYQAQGKLDTAADNYNRSISIKPDYAEAHYGLGTVSQAQGKLDTAAENYNKAILTKPDYAHAYNNLAAVFQAQEKLGAAVENYKKAIAILPDFADAHHNLGNVLQAQGKLELAAESYRNALSIKPDLADAHHNLGNVLQTQGKLNLAIESYHNALSIKSDFADAHYNLGNALRIQGKLDAAVENYNKAISIKPDFAEANHNLALAFHQLGQLNKAEASFRRALEIEPDSFAYAVRIYLLLPNLHESLESIAYWRERFQKGIAVLEGTGYLKELRIPVAASFDLAYHNQNDRPLMESLCRLFRAKAPDITATAAHVPSWQAPSISGRRIRVGFLSEYLKRHTIGKLNQGLIRHMDRRRFEVVVIHSDDAQDSLSHELGSLADKSLTLPVGLAAQQDAISAEKLDVLFYPDIGMSHITYALAFARLAPVQAVSWGHPDTTGLDSMDYFVSAASIEPEDAEDHYTENLIRLNRLPCFYPSPAVAPRQIDNRSALGLPETGTLYGCPQSLFKFHPDFDGILAAIAEGDPSGWIVLLEGTPAIWTELLKARWAKTFPHLLKRVIFLPRVPMDRFMSLLAHMDVLLDPVHFGSGNTLYEAMAYGVPVVTWPGRFARGRIVAGAYRQMGIANAPIASRLEDYAPLALALGRSPEQRLALRQMLMNAAKLELFGDWRAVREFEHFLEDAVAAAGRGEKLPRTWHPPVKQNATQ